MYALLILLLHLLFIRISEREIKSERKSERKRKNTPPGSREASREKRVASCHAGHGPAAAWSAACAEVRSLKPVFCGSACHFFSSRAMRLSRAG